MSAVYNTVFRSNLINTFTFGLTRIGLNQAGTVGAAYTLDTITSFQNYNSSARGFVRIAPAYNLVDDLNWIKGRHTITAGVNTRLIRNDKSSYTNSYPSFSFRL
jgi:hypothetical protein